MVEELISALLMPILQAGPAVTAILLLITAALGYLSWKREDVHRRERTELMDKLMEQQEDMLEVIEKYQAGQLTVVQAINEIKVLVAAIGAKI